MRIKRSQSVRDVGNSNKKLTTSQSPIQANQSTQKQIHRRFSLTSIKNRSSSLQLRNTNNISNKSPQKKQNDKMQEFKQKIIAYIEKRSDVEIINFQNQYKEQFFRKSANLQSLLYQQPEIRQKYLNDETDGHFFKGFQHTLLALFRKGTIVPGQYRNMKMSTVEDIQKWVFSWVKRKKNYEQAVQEQKQSTNQALNVVKEINLWANNMRQQNPIF